MARRVRRAALAGTFYPGDPDLLRQSVDDMLDAARPTPGAAAPRALIAPHAGHIYSGPIAASAYALIRGRRDIERVVLLGPAHRVSVKGIAAPSSDAFATPLGEIDLDRAAIEALQDLPFVEIDDAPHAQEHSLEVHLPFLQRSLDHGFELIPLVVGGATGAQIREVLARFEDRPDTLIVISSDLSHFHDYETAQRLDEATALAIERLDPTPIGPREACGCRPIHGALLMARHKSLKARRVDLRSSGDTAGSRDRVVGYGAWVLER